MRKFSFFSRRDNLVQSKIFSNTMVKPEKHGARPAARRERAGALVGSGTVVPLVRSDTVRTARGPFFLSMCFTASR
jgi:hypothetical protein